VVGNIQIGSTVIWATNSYIVVDITKKGLILKQNFSIGTILKGEIPVDEVSLKNY
tara:strand:- start:2722 stop:2886 length:165 start_codon:yes stop_codon:yes gene_type:complete